MSGKFFGLWHTLDDLVDDFCLPHTYDFNIRLGVYFKTGLLQGRYCATNHLDDLSAYLTRNEIFCLCNQLRHVDYIREATEEDEKEWYGEILDLSKS